ncbi:MAG: peroxiredoxin family protein [Planctomycetota bacterium]
MMGSVINAVSAGCLLVGTLCACSEDSASASASASASRAPQDGAQLLREMAKAYRAAPALTDEFQVEFNPGGSKRIDMRSLAAGPGAEARLVMDGFEFTAVDGQVFVVRADRPGKYFSAPLAGTLPDTFRGLTRGNTLPFPQLALRYGQGPEDYLPSFGMHAAENLKVAGRDTVAYGGRTVERLRLTGDQNATVTALVDPETKFLERVEVVIGRMNITASMSPKRLDRLPEVIRFEAKGRRRVETLGQVVVLGKGDPAPDFTLPTLGGRPVTLSEHRGSMVVLDFWATWCGWCKKGMPGLQQFQDWARAEGLAIEVVPVNIGERHPTREAKKKAVEQYWQSQGFTMQTLMDYDNTTVRDFEIGPLPHTVVVGPDGVIHAVGVGYKPDLTDQLKQMARELKITPRKSP